MQHRFSTSSTSPIDRRLLHFIHLYLSIYFLSWVDKCVISKHKFGFIYFIYSDYCGSRLARIDEKVCVAVWCVHCRKGRKLKASIVSTTSVFFFCSLHKKKIKDPRGESEVGDNLLLTRPIVVGAHHRQGVEDNQKVGSVRAAEQQEVISPRRVLCGRFFKVHHFVRCAEPEQLLQFTN